MVQKRKNKKVVSSIVSLLIILSAFIYYQFGDGFEDTEIVQNNYSSKDEVVTSNVSVSSDLEIYFFDVGQADCILVSNDGKNMLIDAGNNEDGKLIVKELKDMGITTIDYLIGTHPHEDHIGGLDDVIDNFNIGILFMPKRQTDTKTFEDVLDSVSNKNLKITTPSIGQTFNLGEALCEVVSVKSDAKETNDSSIVIELSFGDKKYLFTGDIEKEVEDECNWEDIDVLKVAHHGSRGSSSKEFLNVTKPEIAIISVGKDNTYNHPHEEALQRLENVDAKIYRTDESGTIYLKSNGFEVSIESLDICLDGNLR